VSKITFDDIVLDNSIPNSRIAPEQQGIESLANSIKAIGLLQPLLVLTTKFSKGKTKEDGTVQWREYKLIAGFRRYAAIAKLRNKDKTFMDEVEVKQFDCSPDDALIINLAENVQRVDLTEAEMAAAIERLQAAGNKLSDIATRLGFSVNWCQRMLSFQRNASEELREAVHTKAITFSEGVKIAKSVVLEEQKDAAAEIAQARKAAKGKGGQDGQKAREKVRKTQAAVTGKVHRPGVAAIDEILEEVGLYEDSRVRTPLTTIFKWMKGTASKPSLMRAVDLIADSLVVETTTVESEAAVE